MYFVTFLLPQELLKFDMQLDRYIFFKEIVFWSICLFAQQCVWAEGELKANAFGTMEESTKC